MIHFLNTYILKNIQSIIQLLDDALDEEGSTNITGGNIIKIGYNSQVDRYRNMIRDSHNWLGQYQSRIISETSLSSLKIKYTNISGYFIEIPKSHMSEIPDTFIHKQTLANAARYITQELLDFQTLLFEAENNMAQHEYDIFQEVRETLMKSYQVMKQLSQQVAYMDFLLSLSLCAYKRKYVCPVFSKSSGYTIEAGRHPVIESIEKDFIHNDLYIGENDTIHVITGPNMGGKSTFLRQNALIVLMAHMGSYVPAAKVHISLTDKIFSRVGANDNLFLGKSTFMVEMQEVSHILQNATCNSFVIIDEVGRGTSTYDGMSLAWGILKYLYQDIGVKTLFATHYHEIIDASGPYQGISNFSVAVGENEEHLVFLRKIIPGGIKKSYGLEVAKIAGVKQKVLDEAREMAKTYISGNTLSSQQLSLGVDIPIKRPVSDIENTLKNIDIHTMTPLEALTLISQLQKKLEK